MRMVLLMSVLAVKRLQILFRLFWPILAPLLALMCAVGTFALITPQRFLWRRGGCVGSGQVSGGLLPLVPISLEVRCLGGFLPLGSCVWFCRALPLVLVVSVLRRFLPLTGASVLAVWLVTAC